MKVRVLKKTSNELKLEIEGAGHALCNLLQKRLIEDKSVDFAGYDVPHPLTPKVIIYVRTKRKAKPEVVLRETVRKTREMNKKLSEELKKAFKT